MVFGRPNNIAVTAVLHVIQCYGLRQEMYGPPQLWEVSWGPGDDRQAGNPRLTTSHSSSHRLDNHVQFHLTLNIDICISYPANDAAVSS